MNDKTTIIKRDFGRFKHPVKMTFSTMAINEKVLFSMTTRHEDGTGFWHESFNKDFDSEAKMLARIKSELKKGGQLVFNGHQ